MEYTSGNVFSTPADLYNGLRWTAILSSKLPNFPVALSGGVHDGDAMIKALLAGASAVEVCSAIYQQGPDVITKMLERVEQWQESKGFTSVAAYRGRMNASAVGAEELFEEFKSHFSEDKVIVPISAYCGLNTDLLCYKIADLLDKVGLASLLAQDYGKYILLAIYLVVFIISQIIASAIRKSRVEKINSLKRQLKRY
jgi:hypothetical protein